MHGRHSTDMKQISFRDSYASRLSVCVTYNFFLPSLLPTQCGCTLLLRPITLNDAGHGRTPPDKYCAPRTDFYLTTTHNTHDRETPMPAACFELAVQQTSGRRPTPRLRPRGYQNRLRTSCLQDIFSLINYCGYC